MKRNIWLSLILPVVLVLVWLGAGGVGGGYFGKLSEVTSNSQSSFLPESADSTRVNAQLSHFQDQSSLPAIIVFEKSSNLSPSDFKNLSTLTKQLATIPSITGHVSPPIPSKDSRAAMVILPVSADASDKLSSIFSDIHQKIDSSHTGLSYQVGGPASFSNDLLDAFGGIDVTLLLVAFASVFVILLIVYRSLLLPIIVLLTAVFALSGAILIIWNLANTGVLHLDGQVQGILFILVIGASTDYSLLYLARLREELTANKSKLAATVKALKGAWEPIVAAGGTVMVGLLCLLLSDLKSNQGLGPVGSIGIAFALLAALTFLPSVMLLLGRAAFWPKRPEYNATRNQGNSEAQHRVWNAVGRLIERYPRRLWVSITVILLILCVGILQLKASGVPQGDLVLGHSDARNAQVLINKHFPGGSGTPTYVLTGEASYRLAAKKLLNVDGVESVSLASKQSPSGTVPIDSASKNQVVDPRMMAAATPSFAPTVYNNTVLLELTLHDAADSEQAQAIIPKLRAVASAVDGSALVGGRAAIQYDTNQTSLRDRTVIIPVILVAITIILALLLRSLIAPVALVLTTLISFGAAIGVSAVVFNHLFNFIGADPAVILFSFVFLVALGVDYNIFLMTRVREEAAKLGVQAGTKKALVVTGGVITSAGVVLAATFAALGVIPILFLAQIAFTVAFGVLLDTIIVRSLLVPALTLQIGALMWWPSKLWRKLKSK